jgi:hypothetical protein
MKTIIVLSAMLLLASCKKGNNTNPAAQPGSPTPYDVRMTDAPGPYSAVNVDIQGIEIKGNDEKDLTYLSVNKGIYNLLDFAGGKDTLIGSALLHTQRVNQIRFILGDRNSVEINGKSYPMTVPSGAESGLKLQVHHDLQPGVAYKVLLDFDAYASVYDQGNGTYSLKPVIRTVEQAVSGSIRGKISPSLMCMVKAINANGSSYFTQTSSTADFLLKGLPAGDYTLILTPQSPYSARIITDVTVTNGNVTDVGVINFQ